MDDILTKKQELDLINYKGKCSYKLCKTDAGYIKPFLEPYDVADSIMEDIKNFPLNSESKDDLFLGAISSGAHTIDYSNIYGFEMDSSWHDGSVMYVFECPGNNFDACYSNGHATEDGRIINHYNIDSAIPLSEHSNLGVNEIKPLLCNRVWHADSGIECFKNEDYGNGKFACFEQQKVYSELLLSIILEFKLKDFYTTNFFKYEFFHKKGDSDSALNLSKIYNTFSDNDFVPLALKKELEVFKPKVIIATSNPCWRLNAFYEKNPSMKKPIIVQVPHPANYRLNNPTRFLENGINITEALYKAKIIDEDEYRKKMNIILERYRFFIIA